MSGVSRAEADMPEFVILTGALGSGKTTLLKSFLELRESHETGIIVNDAGEINVDGAILESVGDRTVMKASSGCICCSAGGDLQQAVDDLLVAHEAGGTHLRRIVLETSGLAEPGPVVRAVSGLRQKRFKLRIVATLDGSRGGDLDDGLPEEAAQLAAAQSVIVTKTDLCDAATLERTREVVRSVNPFASHLVIADMAERAHAAFHNHQAPEMAAISAFRAYHQPAYPRVDILLATWSPAPDWPEIAEWLENVAGFCASGLLRVKGIVSPAASGRRLLINAVGRIFAEPLTLPQALPQTPPGDNSEEGLVLILRDVDTDALMRFSESVSDRAPRLSRRDSLGRRHGRYLT